MTHRELRCPNGCATGRFEALNAPMYVDMSGRYLDHDARQATYVCAICQAVAIDVAGAARQMRRDGGTEAATILRCPGCATHMLVPEDDPDAVVLECPECGTRFTREEGMTELHGGGIRELGWDAAAGDLDADS